MAATCPPSDQILAFVLGKLPDAVAETVAGHLDSCTKCDGTAALLEHRPDRLLAEIKRPTGDPVLLGEADFRRASRLISEFGHEPSDVGVDRLALKRATTGQTLGQYRLLEKLGEGGMGTVYKALHTRLEKVVAVKVLPPERLQDPSAVARFEREMKAVGKLDHPHIVRAMDAGEADGTHYLVMEYVEGMDLGRLAKRRGPLPIAAGCELVRQAAIGLAAAHRLGMVHRDIKPGNLMLTRGTRDEERGASAHGNSSLDPRSAFPEPSVKVLDLGLALLADPNDALHDLTGSGQVMGTLDYMAPEQGSSSHAVDARADVYSLGATLYKLLTGAAVFDGDQLKSPMEKMVALATLPATPIRQRRPEVPENLAHIIGKMIAKKPEERYASAADVAMALAPWATGANLAALLDPSTKLSSGPAPITRPNGLGTSNSPAKARQTWLLVAAGIAAAVIGVIFLAVVLSLQTSQGTITVEVDPKFQDDVSLLVTGGGKKIELSDKSGWQIKVEEGAYHIDVHNSADKFDVSESDVAVRRGDNMILRVTRKPPPVAIADGGAKPAGDPPLAEPKEVGEKVLRWLRDNNSRGPEGRLMDDLKSNIDAQTRLGRGFSYRLSGALMKSGKPTEIAVHGPHWVAHELTPEQAKQLNLTEVPIAGFRPGPIQAGEWAKEPEFQLLGLELDHEDTLGKDGRVQGWVRFKRLRRGAAMTHYFVRVVFLHDTAVTLAQGITGDLTPEGEGRLRLDMASPLAEKFESGTMAVFIDIGKFAAGKERSEDFNDFIALSAPLSRMLTLFQAEKPSP